MSSTRHATVLSLSRRGCGYIPFLTPLSHVVLPTGMIGAIFFFRLPIICSNRTKPLSGNVRIRITAPFLVFVKTLLISNDFYWSVLTAVNEMIVPVNENLFFRSLWVRNTQSCSTTRQRAGHFRLR